MTKDIMRRREIKSYCRFISNLSSDHPSMEGLLLKHGKFFTPQEKPDYITWGKVRECFKNAYYLADSRNGNMGIPALTYCEGLAISDIAPFPIHHGWVVDELGLVIDNTWRTPGVLYYGIPFELGFVNKVLLEREKFSIIDFDSPTFARKYRGDLK